MEAWEFLGWETSRPSPSLLTGDRRMALQSWLVESTPILQPLSLVIERRKWGKWRPPIHNIKVSSVPRVLVNYRFLAYWPVLLIVVERVVRVAQQDPVES
jgi:hypothetical protein